MGRYAIWQFGRKARRERIVRRLVSHINSGDYQAASDCLSPDLVVAEIAGKDTIGRGAFLLRSRSFREEYGNPQLIIDTLDHHGEEILARAHHASELAELTGPTFWRIAFDEDAINLIETTHGTSHRFQPRDHPGSQAIAG